MRTDKREETSGKTSALEAIPRDIFASCILAVVLIVLMPLLVAFCTDTPEVKAQKMCENETQAFLVSKEFVKKRLRSPSTAEFPFLPISEGVSVHYLGDCKHAVWGYVDAQNAFGATIRSRYYAQVQNIKSTDEWKWLNIEIH